MFAWRDGTPAGRFSVHVSDQPRCGSGSDALLHRLAIAFAFLRGPLLARQPPPHAPTTGARAVLAKEFLEVGPARGRQRMDQEFHVSGPAFPAYRPSGFAGRAGSNS